MKSYLQVIDNPENKGWDMKTSKGLFQKGQSGLKTQELKEVKAQTSLQQILTLLELNRMMILLDPRTLLGVQEI